MRPTLGPRGPRVTNIRSQNSWGEVRTWLFHALCSLLYGRKDESRVGLKTSFFQGSSLPLFSEPTVAGSLGRALYPVLALRFSPGATPSVWAPRDGTPVRAQRLGFGRRGAAGTGASRASNVTAGMAGRLGERVKQTVAFILNPSKTLRFF